MKPSELGPRARGWRDQIEIGTAAKRAEAALNLGRHLLALEKEEGLALLRLALQGSDQQITCRAMWALTETLVERGEVKPSVADYISTAEISADRSAHYVVLASAARLAACGYGEEAITAYRRFLDEGSDADRELVAFAAYRLGDLYFEAGKVASAVRLMRKAIRDGSGPLRTHAMSELADWLAQLFLDEGHTTNEIPAGLPQDREGVREVAETLYGRVVASDHADLAPRAAYYLALLRLGADDWISAEEGLRAAISSEHPVYSPLAEAKLHEVVPSDESRANIDGLIADIMCHHQLQLSMQSGGECLDPDGGDCAYDRLTFDYGSKSFPVSPPIGHTYVLTLYTVGHRGKDSKTKLRESPWAMCSLAQFGTFSERHEVRSRKPVMIEKKPLVACMRCSPEEEEFCGEYLADTLRTRC